MGSRLLDGADGTRPGAEGIGSAAGVWGAWEPLAVRWLPRGGLNRRAGLGEASEPFWGGARAPGGALRSERRTGGLPIGVPKPQGEGAGAGVHAPYGAYVDP